MYNNIEWICPKCESQSYFTIDVWTGPTDTPKGFAKRPVIKTLYMCDKCSCIFGNPDKFNLVTDLDYDKQSIETLKRQENERKENEK